MKVLLSVVLVVGLCTPAYADSFRCNGKVVLQGASQGEVIDKCGKPVLREDRGYKQVGDDYVKVVALTFNLGSGKFVKILEFENGKLKNIENGPRQ